MSVIAYVTVKRISPNKGVDLAVPKMYSFDTAQLTRQVTNLKRGGAVIKFLDPSRKSAKIEVYETVDQINVAVDPNVTTNPNAIDLNLAFAALGGTQGAAAPLVNYLTKVTSATAASADGVLLPTAAVGGKPFVVVNGHATVTVKVYPGTGATINALAVNLPFSILPGGRAHFVPTALLTWLTAV